MNWILKLIAAIIFLAAVIFMLASCSKSDYKPDWDAVKCERCISISEQWKEAEMVNLISSRIAADTSLCGAYLINFKRAVKDTIFRVCDNDGITKYWQRWINKTDGY